MWRYCFIFSLLCVCLVLSERKEQNFVETVSSPTKRLSLPGPAAIVFGNPIRTFFGRHRLYPKYRQQKDKKDQRKPSRRAKPKHESARATIKKSLKHKQLYGQNLH